MTGGCLLPGPVTNKFIPERGDASTFSKQMHKGLLTATAFCQLLFSFLSWWYKFDGLVATRYPVKTWYSRKPLLWSHTCASVCRSAALWHSFVVADWERQSTQTHNWRAITFLLNRKDCLAKAFVMERLDVVSGTDQGSRWIGEFALKSSAHVRISLRIARRSDGACHWTLARFRDKTSVSRPQLHAEWLTGDDCLDLRRADLTALHKRKLFAVRFAHGSKFVCCGYADIV